MFIFLCSSFYSTKKQYPYIYINRNNIIFFSIFCIDKYVIWFYSKFSNSSYNEISYDGLKNLVIKLVLIFSQIHSLFDFSNNV